MSIGERIIALRKDADLSQGDLAKMLNVSRQAISKWENDQSSPDTLRLIQLADLLKTDIEFLATGRHSPREPQPIVVNLARTEEKIVEKLVEKPVIQRIVRYKYLRNPWEYLLIAVIAFLMGLIIGTVLL